MKKLLLLSGLFFSVVGFAQTSHSTVNIKQDDYIKVDSDKKKYCIWIRQDGKNWYECSPLAYSPSNAVDLMKKKYPKATVTRASDSSCDCD